MTLARSPSPDGSDSDAGGLDFMEEPSSFRPATPPPTIRSYQRRKFGRPESALPVSAEEEVDVGLVSGHPLWGHILYPAAIAMSRFLELHSDTLLRSTEGEGKGKGKAVIELGAGGGLPGLVAALEGAEKVVISDFPDPALVNNLAKNVERNIEGRQGVAETKALGFTWGSSPAPLFEAINDPSSSPSASPRKFDLILLSDLVFNHSQHSALLESCLSLLSPSLSSPSPSTPSSPSLPLLPDIDLSEGTLQTPTVLCFFSHHRPTPQLIEADLGILSAARARGWTVRRVWKDEGAGPAFPEDEGDLCIRGTVHGFAFTRE